MKILIVGQNGFISSELYELFKNNNFDVHTSSRKELDFLDQEKVENYFNNKQFDILIYTPIFGGRRTKNDDMDIVQKNVLMHENLLAISHKFKIIFYFGSGASFNRNQDIFEYDDHHLGKSIPTDPYGLSKFSMEKNIRSYKNFINIRIFNCFGLSEVHNRMIKANILNYINKKNIIIHEDKFFDFFYVEDLFILLKSRIDEYQKNKYISLNEINSVYKEKYKLSDIANFINNLDNHKVDIIKNENYGKSYCGKNKISKNYMGLIYGMNNMYQNLKEKIFLDNISKKVNTIVLDFDDTIVWSEEIKSNKFIEISSKYGKIGEEFYNENMKDNIKGYNRYEYLHHLCTFLYERNLIKDLKKMYSELVDKYTNEVRKEILENDEVKNVSKVLKHLHKEGYKLYISSKSVKSDIDYILKEKNLLSLFSDTYDQTVEKVNHVKQIMRENNIKSENILFMGDSIGDYHTAMTTNCYFIGIEKNESKLPEMCKKINDYNQLLNIFGYTN